MWPADARMYTVGLRMRDCGVRMYNGLALRNSGVRTYTVGLRMRTCGVWIGILGWRPDAGSWFETQGFQTRRMRNKLSVFS